MSGNFWGFIKGVKYPSEFQEGMKKTKTMASDPITSWQINGETVETARNFIFLGSKITPDGEFSHDI